MIYIYTYIISIESNRIFAFKPAVFDDEIQNHAQGTSERGRALQAHGQNCASFMYFFPMNTKSLMWRVL